jgi:hypothetical protein
MATEYRIPIQEILSDYTSNDRDYLNYEIEDRMDQIDGYVLKRFPQIKRGDVINLLNRTQRKNNEGTLIWNGFTAVHLYETQVPSEFEIDDFNFKYDHWSQYLDNKMNGVSIWPSKEIRERASQKMKKIEIYGSTVYFATFNIGTTNFVLVYDNETNNSPQEFRKLILNSEMHFEDPFQFDTMDPEVFEERVCKKGEVILRIRNWFEERLY